MSVKAILMDYTDTVIEQAGPEIEEMIFRVASRSDFPSAREALGYWFTNLSRMEREARGDLFVSEDEICLRLLGLCRDEHGLVDSHEELRALNQGLWRNGPLYGDVGPFFEKCPLPVYIITNNGAEYVEENLSRKGISPAGVVSAEEVRAYKPYPEIFMRALERAGLTAEEVIHVGDSLDSDVLGAKNVGIEPILVDRAGKYSDTEVRRVGNLAEVLDYI